MKHTKIQVLNLKEEQKKLPRGAPDRNAKERFVPLRGPSSATSDLEEDSDEHETLRISASHSRAPIPAFPASPPAAPSAGRASRPI